MSAERVLEDLMGLPTTRPEVIETDLHALFLAIDKNELNEAKDKIAALRSRIGDDPDLARADVLIRRKEVIGR
ncbi:hypothetical protein D3C75_1255620 [compost metagenome]